MRFDDMLATLMARPLEDPAAGVAAWRQAADILAQGRGGDATGDALRFLADGRDGVPIAIRIDVARSLSGRRAPLPLLLLLADDAPPVAAAALGAVRLDAADWIDLLPRLGPSARGVVRNRRDLPADVVQALAAFGRVDLVVGGPEGCVPAAAPPTAMDGADGNVRISDLVARIAAYQAERSTRPEAEPPLATAFSFETAPDGAIAWTDATQRGALIGASIAYPAEDGEGVDGQAAGAFRQRAPFRDARLTIAGKGPVSGEWRISAVPAFDPFDGRFIGYRGGARRPRADETTAPRAAGETELLGTGMPPDSMRQLVHELRTPINAIMGFAEMIEAQMLGPVALDYRYRATEISADGRRLLAAIDDLDVAARIDGSRWLVEGGAVDAGALLARLHGDYEAIARDRGVELAVRIGAGIAPIDADPVSVERMFARMLAATIGLAVSGEAIAVTLTGDGATVELNVQRPAAMAGRDERALLDPGYSPEGDWPDAPLLGLGFALRLVRNLAAAAGGELLVETGDFRLRLPARDGDLRTGRTAG